MELCLLRGQVVNKARYLQVRDFSGLRWNNITPTDIDGLIDFQDRLFVFFELKRKGNAIPRGQEMAIERVVREMGKGKPTIAFVAEHEDDGETIHVAEANVVSYYWKGQWYEMELQETLKHAIDGFIEKNK
jgi:hypothetical protein